MTNCKAADLKSLTSGRFCPFAGGGASDASERFFNTAPLDRTAHCHCAAAAEYIDETLIVVRHQLVDDPQQLALAAYPGDKAVQDAPSFKGKASSDRSNPRLAAASPFSMF